MITCTKCKIEKPRDSYYTRLSGQWVGKHYQPCRDCRVAHCMVWRNATRPEFNRKRREYRRDLRLQVLEHYGKECECCQETELEFLEIDHINGDGKRDREEIGYGAAFFHWIIDNNYPKTLRILCRNCNGSRGKDGYCIHETQRVAYA